MCTALLPPGGYPIAVNKYIISYHVLPLAGNRTFKERVHTRWALTDQNL